MRPGQDRPERRPQLVRHHRQELVLGAIGGFGGPPGALLHLVRPRSDDRDGDALGGELQELDLVRHEGSRAPRPDADHADDAFTDEERNVEQRPQPGLDRVWPHPRLAVEVRHRHGTALGGDAPRESAAERHPHAFVHVAVEALGGPHHQHVVLFVEEEYECAADAEDAPDPLEQLAEHVVEGEAAERHLDDALHPSQQLRRAFRVAARLVLADQQPAALVLRAAARGRHPDDQQRGHDE